MANVLVLGKGYIGTELESYLNKDLHKVFFCSKKELDYENFSLFNKFLGHNRIDYVINCVGFTGRPNVDEGEIKKDLCWHLNVVLPLKLKNICKNMGAQYIHISSGCIYNGYEKEFTEEDKPNFGLYDESSFYSKTKHAFETLFSIDPYGAILRIRMPFSDNYTNRNFIKKIINYDNLINYVNSKTYIPDLCFFIEYLIDKKYKISDIGILNFVNPEAKDTEFLTKRLKVYHMDNPNWKFVDIKDIDIKAPRSNCVLSMDKFKKLFPDYYVMPEEEAIEGALCNLIIEHE